MATIASSETQKQSPYWQQLLAYHSVTEGYVRFRGKNFGPDMKLMSSGLGT